MAVLPPSLLVEFLSTVSLMGHTTSFRHWTVDLWLVRWWFWAFGMTRFWDVVDTWHLTCCSIFFSLFFFCYLNFVFVLVFIVFICEHSILIWDIFMRFDLSWLLIHGMCGILFWVWEVCAWILIVWSAFFPVWPVYINILHFDCCVLLKIVRTENRSNQTELVPVRFGSVLLAYEKRTDWLIFYINRLVWFGWFFIQNRTKIDLKHPNSISCLIIIAHRLCT